MNMENLQSSENGGVILTISIPSYNGASTLEETLDSVTSQLEYGVDILISDNASTDVTADIVRKYQATYPQIRYRRNDKNLGMGPNFNLAVQHAQGEYVWLFSDDDTMVPGAIRTVLSVINSHRQLAAIYVNWSTMDSPGAPPNKPAIALESDKLCEDHNTFISTVRLNAVLLSSLVVKADLWRNSNSESYTGSVWAQYATMLEMIVGEPSYCIAAPLVRYRPDSFRFRLDSSNSKNLNQQKLDNMPVRLNYLLSLAEILRDLNRLGYSRKAIRTVTNVALLDLRQIIRGCKRSSLPWKYFILLPRAFFTYPVFLFKSLPLLLVPGIFYQLYYNSKRTKHQQAVE